MFTGSILINSTVYFEKMLMWINCIAYYTLISVVNVNCISSVNVDSFTAVTSSKTDNAVFIYPGEVN